VSSKGTYGKPKKTFGEPKKTCRVSKKTCGEPKKTMESFLRINGKLKKRYTER
jgi:hypothetical protein